MKRISVLLLIFSLLVSVFSVGINADTSDYILTKEAYLPFNDTENNVWYTPALEFCYSNKLMSGLSGTVFSPSGDTTREQMVTVLAKMSGEVIGEITESFFCDVDINAWYAEYVNWAMERGYTNGVGRDDDGNSYFGIGSCLTRAQAVTFLYNYSVNNEIECDTTGDLSDFEDAGEIADWAKDAFGWAVKNSVVRGSYGKLHPEDKLTRAELAQLIMNFELGILHASCEHEYTEASCTESAKCINCGLATGLPNGHYCTVLNCEKGSPCVTCGEFIAPKGHKYKAATCTQPMICAECAQSCGAALGHTSNTAICSRCNAEFFKTSYEKFAYYMTETAMSDGYTKYLSSHVNYSDGSLGEQYIKYDTLTKKSTVEMTYRFNNSEHYITTTVYIDSVSSNYSVSTSYYNGSRLTYSGTSQINAALFNPDVLFLLEEYEGPSPSVYEFTELTKKALLLNLYNANELLSLYCDLTLKDFGFILM